MPIEKRKKEGRRRNTSPPLYRRRRAFSWSPPSCAFSPSSRCRHPAALPSSSPSTRRGNPQTICLPGRRCEIAKEISPRSRHDENRSLSRMPCSPRKYATPENPKRNTRGARAASLNNKTVADTQERVTH